MKADRSNQVPGAEVEGRKDFNPRFKGEIQTSLESTAMTHRAAEEVLTR